MSRLNIGQQQIAIRIPNGIFENIPKMIPVFHPYKKFIGEINEGFNEAIDEILRLADIINKSNIIDSVDIYFDTIDRAVSMDLIDVLLKTNKQYTNKSKEIKLLLDGWIKKEFEEKNIRLTKKARSIILNIILLIMLETDKVITKEKNKIKD